MLYNKQIWLVIDNLNSSVLSLTTYKFSKLKTQKWSYKHHQHIVPSASYVHENIPVKTKDAHQFNNKLFQFKYKEYIKKSYTWAKQKEIIT